jgi:polysaccharide biosynthesis transport protein
MESYTKNISDYIDLLGRRKYYIIIPWVLISLIALVVAFNLPKVYKSTATMLMEAPTQSKLTDLPNHLYADEQIQTIYQRVLTTEKILSIIETYGLYGDTKDSSTKYDLVGYFKEDTQVELANSLLLPNNAKVAEIVFNLSFNYGDATKSKEVVTELARLLIEQNDKARTQRAVKVTDFLLVELEKLSRNGQELDSKIAKYKEQNIFSLPEQAQANLAAIDRTENELRDTDNQIRATKDKITFLGVELARAQTEFSGVLNDNLPRSKEDALRILQAKYTQLSGIYSPSHPDVIRAQRELKALGSSVESDTRKAGIAQDLVESKHELSLLRETYTGTHPELVKRRKQIDTLEQQLKNAKPNSERDMPVRAANPAYFGLEGQYKSSQSELKSLIQKQEYLKAKLENTRNILSVGPQVEVEYTDLIRERDSTIHKYNQLKEKWLDAKLVQAMEEQQQGQTLSIIEPAIIPNHPEKAIRRKVVIGGFFVGLFGGIALAFLAEFLHPGIRGYRSLVAATGLMPLVVIPYIESFSEDAHKLAKGQQTHKIAVWTTVVCILLVVAAILFFPMPLAQGDG